MSRPVELVGRPASPGLALGPPVPIETTRRARVPTGDPRREAEDLRAAIGAAISELAALSERLDEDAVAVLEFQIAMLQDEALSGPVFQAIRAGQSADTAWAVVLDAETAGYERAEDEYFRARAADLRDIRDRVLDALDGAGGAARRPGAILVGSDLTPSRFLETDWEAGGGIVLTAGSASSHVAMLARSRGVPMVVGLGDAEIAGHDEIIVDGGRGTVVLSPGHEMRARFADAVKQAVKQRCHEAAFLDRPAVTADGTPVAVLVNLASLDDLGRVDAAHCDGVGLLRTEFLFGGGPALPDEDAQFDTYCRFIEWARGRPVTIRTLDAGADKPIAGLTADGEANPFLGLRGLRLSLARPDVFRVQLRALARAAATGDVKVMFPMVTHPRELDQAVALFEQVLAELSAERVPAKRPPLGMMVEVPAAAMTPELFEGAAFFSIGSNDLVQYVTAAARDGAHTGDLYDPGCPAVRRLIETVAACGARSGREVSICGDMAGEPAFVPMLLDAGLRTLSVAPSALGRVKATLAGHRLAGR